VSKWEIQADGHDGRMVDEFKGGGMKSYGKELILDLHDCRNLPMGRGALNKFCEKLCERIDMKREDIHFWDYEGEQDAYDAAPEHLKGISVIQFISTSNITLHTLDETKKVYLNIFSCKDFYSSAVKDFAESYFGGHTVNKLEVPRI